jgi:ATP adenylyltransferase/5',5'''-P-1,P-4-tetraphosphate phosphorylase II
VNNKLSLYRLFKSDEVNSLLEGSDYASAAKVFFKQQLNDWESLKVGYDALEKIKTKEFWFKGYKIKVQYNPQRIKSTSAKTDSDSINSRRCFLCTENWPEEQRGIVINKKYILLCNPYPIFPEHFTIASIEHSPQVLEKRFSYLLEITRALAPNYILIYNGPTCGASAPDHFHFQAGTKKYMPIEDDIYQIRNEYGKVVFKNEKVILTSVDDGLRRMITIKSTEEKILQKAFEQFYNCYKSFTPESIEPMFNIISSYDEEFGGQVIIFLRSKHRSTHYSNTGNEKIMISPAAVDLGGVVITPNEKDFEKMDRSLIAEVFKEISIDKISFDEITAELSEKVKSLF